MQKLPIGIQTFRKIREENFLYIDKTKEIKQEKKVAKKDTKKEDINKKNTEELNESTSTSQTDVEVKEKINGLITLRGDAQDDTYFHSIIVMFNGKEVIANGKNFWESLYDLTKISNVKKDKNNEINCCLTWLFFLRFGESFFWGILVKICLKIQTSR